MHPSVTAEPASPRLQAPLWSASPRAGVFLRFLPEARMERVVWLALALTVLVLKVFVILHFRADSDETQHAHVVWAISRGQLDYRDFFDNHTPLFHLAFAPIFRLLGEHAYIMIQLRLAMLPLYFACLWCVWKLASTLYSKRIAAWACLSAAALPPFLYTSTEFRPDNLWAAAWLFALVVALCGEFTLRRAFTLGLLLGLCLAVSIKTPVLWAALAASAAIAFALNAWMGNLRVRWKQVAVHLVVIAAGTVIIPGAIVSYFAWKGALGMMYYCVIQHNMLPGLKRWSHMSVARWVFPASVPALAGLGVLIFRQASDSSTAIRRTILLLMPGAFAALLYSYSPEITRQDNLPYYPLLPLLLIPFAVWLRGVVASPALDARFFKWFVPAVCFIELLFVWNLNPLRSDRLKGTTETIRDVLLLTGPNDYVMDSEGDYVFRQRADYWVFETVTKARIERDLIQDFLPECLIKNATTVCYLMAGHVLPKSTQFILANYLPFDKTAIDVGVAGKVLANPAADGTFSFDVAIPTNYAVVSETGDTAGALDGAPYAAPIALAAGHHTFRRTSGRGRLAIFLNRAYVAGFRPLFDADEKFIAAEAKRPG